MKPQSPDWRPGVTAWTTARKFSSGTSNVESTSCTKNMWCFQGTRVPQRPIRKERQAKPQGVATVPGQSTRFYGTRKLKARLTNSDSDLQNRQRGYNRIRFTKGNPQGKPETDNHNNCNLAWKRHYGDSEANGNLIVRLGSRFVFTSSYPIFT